MENVGSAVRQKQSKQGGGPQGGADTEPPIRHNVHASIPVPMLVVASPPRASFRSMLSACRFQTLEVCAAREAFFPKKMAGYCCTGKQSLTIFQLRVESEHLVPMERGSG